MQTTTIVLPSARAIRDKYLELSDSLDIPHYITMSDFISKLCIVSGFKSIDEDSAYLLLMEAADFKSFSKLQIDRNFFTFTKNATYIFRLFQELSTELYDIKELKKYDVYGDFYEHISILEELYARYEKLCYEKKLLDTIFLPKLYKFNHSYAKSHSLVEIYAEGYLTNFEFELLDKCSQYTNVHIHFNATKFNTKMQKKFAKYGIELKEGFWYKIDFKNKKILELSAINKNRNISCSSFTQDILQVAYIEQKVYEFVQKGYDPSKIAVVLPNESFASVLRSFDKSSNYNFAMGTEFFTTPIYKKLDAMRLFLEQDSKENLHRLNRFGSEYIDELSSIYYKKVFEADFFEFLLRYKESFGDKDAKEIFDEEIYKLRVILPSIKELNIKSILNIFLQRLSKRTLDDVGGGKITVMGLLETRMLCFDAVIIVDFDDSNVPKKSDKDMFLNTYLRESANLPTTQDRENLQKYYYEMLLNRSGEVAISYVKSEQSSGSKFLKELGILEKNLYLESSYASILFESVNKAEYIKDEIVLDYSFVDEKLSNSKLKAFLTCKRKYYYRHIMHIKEHLIPKDIPQEYQVGSDIHNALKNLYTKKRAYFDLGELKKDLFFELDSVCANNEFSRYMIELQKAKMDKFCKIEIERFLSGYEVAFCEVSKEIEFSGMKMLGQIDRIDIRENKLFILDYKTGSYPIYNEKNLQEATDFQLEFYYLLGSSFGEVESCAYYDLNEQKIVNEPFLKEKLDILEAKIKELLSYKSIEFSKCEDTKNCLYCEYKIMCGRE